jgi:serine/threonine protein kinase
MEKEIKLIKKDEHKIIYLITSQDGKTIEKILPLEAKSLYLSLMNVDLPIPHIKKIYESQGKLIVDEEYIEALTLDDYKKRQPLTHKQIISIMNQLLDILDVLHHHDPIIVHRDIKPENIYYDGEKIILGDFDIARFYEAKHTVDTTILGSIGYAAPEQFGFSQTSVTTDLYSCGVLLNVLATGYMPSVSLVKGMFRPIVKRATEINPADRYQSAKEMKRSLAYCTLVPVGFRKGKKAWKILASILYVLLFAFTLLLVFSIKKDLFWSMVLVFSFYIWIYFFLFNYANIYDSCLFHKNRYPVIRLFGIILTALLTYFVFLCVFGLLVYGFC